ncbi:DUF5635 domain-containing protein [Actinomyces bovis]|uniref:DUF5635 domain-containing protein n=1 Tax=Actinomyces bovis TaxID=1658 RepID=UPI001E2DB783|nr:DUF5635 domain-containing protein [Actinomyces bovis]
MDRRDQLRQEVSRILASEVAGVLTSHSESASIDFKEEAGRRNGTSLEPGSTENPAAATKLADEVACMANSPGGGALILGVEDGSGVILGTELNLDWLRQRIHQAIDVAPAIEEHHVGGQRLLVLYVAESREPVPDTHDRLRWRVGDSCRPVDRTEWWLHREQAQNHDSMADTSSLTIKDVTPAAMTLVRASLNAETTQTNRDLLRQIAALRSDDHLSQAARLTLTPAHATLLELTVLDVFGGSVTNRITPAPELSLLEQVNVIEQALASLNEYSAQPSERFSLTPQRKVPPSAIREAILNGVIHRDWNSPEPTEVRWITLDSALIVRSPGGFTGGIDASNVLSNRHARYPALADLFRALSLVEKQGLGVDRMYAAMIPLGHRPPSIVEESGPHVVCTLRGGDPILPVAELFKEIRPLPRQRDTRVAVIIDQLLRSAFVTATSVAQALQTDQEGAEAALRATGQCTVGSTPLIEKHNNAWLLGPIARETVRPARQSPWFAEVLPYASTTLEDCISTALAWCHAFETISTGDLMRLAGISRGTAQKALVAMTERRQLRRVGSGRSTAYRLAPEARPAS